MKTTLLAAAAAASLGLAATQATAEAVPHTLDPDHSTIYFTWMHGEFSTTRGVYFDVEGDLMFDADAPENSSVTVEFPLGAMTVDPELKGHLQSDQFFGDWSGEMVTFTSTSIEVTGDDTGTITGDLTMNGVTQPVTLDATFNGAGAGPRGNQIVGFDATTTILRSDFDAGFFAPFISDEMQVDISIEASPTS
ncbi:MAG: YceI family protein [Shimia sp.]